MICDDGIFIVCGGECCGVMWYWNALTSVVCRAFF